MRLIPARKLVPQPAKIKGTVSEIHHIDVPLKGLSLLGKTSTGDPLTATILDNWVIKEDKICIRPGSRRIYKHAQAIDTLMPYHGSPEVLLAGTNGTIAQATTGLVLKSGFANNDWHWTMFADLAQAKHLILVNGADGVWSYDGGSDLPSASIPVTSLSNANPAVCTVSAANIVNFHNGDTVLIAGGTGTGMVNANGYHVISSVGSPANTFTLVGVNTSSAGAPQTTGVTAVVMGAVVKEVITAPGSAPYCNPDQFHVVLAHINRLYFADRNNLAVFYLPLQSKSGVLEVLPMNAIFRRGGSIRALASWSVDGGSGMDDKLVVFTSGGECAIYTGIDPADDGFGLIGVYQFDDPMSKRSIVNYGGDLWVLTSTGLAPLSVLMRAETEKLNKAEKGIVTAFTDISSRYHFLHGWSAILDNQTGRIICNMPLGASGGYQQMVRHMPDPVWSRWKNIGARAWSWMAEKLYYGTDAGWVCESSDLYFADEIPPVGVEGQGNSITAEVRPAWNAFKTPGIKHFKLVRVYAQSSGGGARPYIDIAVNYFDSRPQNLPEVIRPVAQTPWGSPWGSPWSASRLPANTWGGVGRLGNVGAPHIVATVRGATYDISGFEVVFEQGIVI